MSPREAVRRAAARLADAGVSSPEHDAAELLAHVLGIKRTQLPLLNEVPADVRARYDALVTRREAREPLQHLTGMAWFRHVRLEVGPGVFVPRPETELLAGWAIELCMDNQLEVVDLCTGSGAIAKALADEAPGSIIHAVELDEVAHSYAARNLAGTGVDLRQGDAFTAFDDLLGRVHVVVCNPPYIPLEAWESVEPEARDHDPHLALFSGQDGLDAIRRLATRAAELLKPGGVLGVEHADVQGESVPAVLTAAGRWTEVRDHRDLAGRPRFTTARLAP
jgi:release factor glutamine methyltransferase